jgi:hypothetical protein
MDLTFGASVEEIILTFAALKGFTSEMKISNSEFLDFGPKTGAFLRSRNASGTGSGLESRLATCGLPIGQTLTVYHNLPSKGERRERTREYKSLFTAPRALP